MSYNLATQEFFSGEKMALQKAQNNSVSITLGANRRGEKMLNSSLDKNEGTNCSGG